MRTSGTPAARAAATPLSTVGAEQRLIDAHNGVIGPTCQMTSRAQPDFKALWRRCRVLARARPRCRRSSPRRRRPSCLASCLPDAPDRRSPAIAPIPSVEEEPIARIRADARRLLSERNAPRRSLKLCVVGRTRRHLGAGRAQCEEDERGARRGAQKLLRRGGACGVGVCVSALDPVGKGEQGGDRKKRVRQSGG